MFRKLLLSIPVLFFTICVFSQGSESFTNANGTVPSSTYTTRSWTGDNGRQWTATNARDDEGAGSSAITGLTGDYIIFRNTTGIVGCSGIPNGCTDISFKYAKAFTAATNPSFALFINGTQVGSVVTATSNLAQTINYTLNVAGAFDLEIRQLTASDAGRLAIDDIIWTAFNTSPCTDPVAQPSGLLLNSTPTSVSGAFTAASPAASEYIVIRSTASSLSADPVDGQVYSAGQNIGGGTVVTVTSATAFTDNGLTPSTQYYYFIYALNSEDCSGGPNYLQAGALTGNFNTQAIPTCTSPASNPGAPLNLTAANTFIAGSFTASPGANRYLVVISSSSFLSANPLNGTTYSAGQVLGGGTVVSFNSSTSFTATGLTANTQYYLFVFAANSECTGEPFYNIIALSGTATTTNSSTGIPAGFYDAANGLTCQALKTSLKTISSTGYNSLSYTPGVWNAYQYTDIKPGGGNLIWDIYTDDNNPAVPETFNFILGTNQCGNYNSEGDCYNREHTTPQSWFNSASPMVSDVHHVLPTDGWVNGKRGNFPFGAVTSASFTSIDNQSKLGTGNNFGYTGTVFEPIDAYKGDLARIALYMATRYEDQVISQNWAGNAEANPAMLTAAEETDAAKRRLQIYENWFLQTMIKWHNEDPVSQKEIDRNNAVYYQSGQANRNPFVDHPEYVFLVWQCAGVVPVTITEFAATKQNNSVLLQWFATQETNFRFYEIERSTDAATFYKVGEVAGRNLANYSFTDNYLPTGSIVYYRLKMVDSDGSYTYSKTVTARLNNSFSNAVIYPNPTTTALNIRLEKALAGNTTLLVTDVTGRKVLQKTVSRGQFSIDLNVSALPAGRYFIRLHDQYDVINQSFVIIK